MKIVHAAALSVAVVCTNGLAQARVEPDPVPTRISVTHYDSGSGALPPLDLSVATMLDRASSHLYLTGGAAGDVAAILVSNRPAAVPLPWGVLLVSLTNAVPIAGLFDQAGTYRFPIDLSDKALIGAELFTQGFHLDTCAGKLNPSAGLQIEYHAGNQQPQLFYAGPLLEAVLCRVTDARPGPATPPRFDLLAKIVAPTTGYDFRFDRVDLEADGTLAPDGSTERTAVYLTVQEPTGGVVLQPEPHRLMVQLLEPRSVIDVRVRLVRRDGPVVPYALAACVERGFGNR